MAIVSVTPKARDCTSRIFHDSDVYGRCRGSRGEVDDVVDVVVVGGEDVVVEVVLEDVVVVVEVVCDMPTAAYAPTAIMIITTMTIAIVAIRLIACLIRDLVESMFKRSNRVRYNFCQDTCAGDFS